MLRSHPLPNHLPPSSHTLCTSTGTPTSHSLALHMHPSPSTFIGRLSRAVFLFEGIAMIITVTRNAQTRHRMPTHYLRAPSSWSAPCKSSTSTALPISTIHPQALQPPPQCGKLRAFRWCCCLDSACLWAGGVKWFGALVLLMGWIETRKWGRLDRF